MDMINIPDISLSEVKLPAWFLKKSASEQAEAIRSGRITDEKQLHKLAKTHADDDVACVAVEKLAAVKGDYSVIALADIALHGRITYARVFAAFNIPRRGFIHAPFIQAGSLPCQGLIYAVSVQADEDLVREFAKKNLLPNTAAAYEVPLHKSILNPRLYDMLYLLDPKEDLDYLVYLARAHYSWATGKVVASVLPPECMPKPEDEDWDIYVTYCLTRKLMCRENDIEALTNVVFKPHSDLFAAMHMSPLMGRRRDDPRYSYDQLISRMAFSRLTGWQHYEPCDSYSYWTCECGRVEGVTKEQIVALCQRVVHEKDQVLAEAAHTILKGFGEAHDA